VRSPSVAQPASSAADRRYTFAVDTTATYYVDVQQADGQVVVCGVLRAPMH
jgi:hypothetical protein